MPDNAAALIWRSEACARFFDEWNGLHRTRALPDAADFDAANLEEFVTNLIIVGCYLNNEAPRFPVEFLHPSIERCVPAQILGIEVTTWLEPPMRERAHDDLRRTVSHPCGLRLIAPLDFGRGTLWIEAVLLPLEDAGRRLKMIGAFDVVAPIPAEMVDHAYGLLENRYSPFIDVGFDIPRDARPLRP